MATEATKAILNLGFNRWNFRRVIACAIAEDTRSVNMMIKTGMSLIKDSLNTKGRLVPRAVIDNTLY